MAQVERAKGGVHDLWVRVSTLEAGQPVWLPLGANRFFNEAPGELANFAQVTVTRDRQVKVTLVKRSEQAKARTQGPDIALDWGMRSMFTTDLGDQLGRRLYPWLRQIDPQLTNLTAELQRQGVKLNSSRRYRRFNQRIRDHVRNEVGRVVNRLVSLYGPRSLTVEQLDFRDGGMSRQMNRLLPRAGRAAVNEKLAAISETLG
ncbi:MAG: RNA-guided endonuclease InsQ/TnpB family protein, partial [Candidatus Dormibacteria bacterium]